MDPPRDHGLKTEEVENLEEKKNNKKAKAKNLTVDLRPIGFPSPN